MDVSVLNSFSLYPGFVPLGFTGKVFCDAPNPRCPLITRQPAKIYTSRVTRHTHE